MDTPKDHVLTASQRAVPIVWFVQLAKRPTRLPDIPNDLLEEGFGRGTSKKLKSWGHDPNGVHWLATRGGTTLHTDPAYARYTHHFIVRNDVGRIRGMDDAIQHPPMLPCALYCLDTHSPHQVCWDERLPEPPKGAPLYKVQVAVDRDRVLRPEDVWALIAPYLRWSEPERGLVEVLATKPARRSKG